MNICREYVGEVAKEANNVCLESGKKTISSEFFYQALKNKGLDDQIAELRIIEEDVNKETSVSLLN
jgi:histone H3/H4